MKYPIPLPITLLEYYAGQALTGYAKFPIEAPDTEIIPKACFDLAEAMIKESEERQNESQTSNS